MEKLRIKSYDFFGNGEKHQIIFGDGLMLDPHFLFFSLFNTVLTVHANFHVRSRDGATQSAVNNIISRGQIG